ncbi:3-oxo-5-alpha-steroid 4-dehydrogenase-domain-containing protein [Xylariales sp. PMI_506]|nr:3-oxo-5-alpha-steroid 4-dehydrogenase-domain-containing protein [Xylariales sp. PMI_506]
MAFLEGWLPPTRQHYEFVLLLWTWYPVLPSLQWAVSWYGMGKTSVNSRLNIPGRIAWFTMECPGFMTLLYIMNTLPAKHGITDLPWQNKVLAGLFVIHYSYRAVVYPFIQPSMSPIHIVVWCAALLFQISNATCIGGWLAAYGPTSKQEWEAQGFSVLQFSIGLVVFYIGLTSNYFCDEELREIRRKEQRRQEKLAREGGNKNDTVKKHYSVPQNGLFKYMLYPHYFMEWIEWLGFWIAAGFGCAPARCFLLNEFFAMLPRAVSGKKWYIEKFGADEVKGKSAVIPGVW